MIEFRNVCLKYPYEEFQLLKSVDFTLFPGLNTIVADSQSGKTTLCRLMIKDLRQDSGQIMFNGVPLDEIPDARLDILYLPAKPAFFERRSILYNVAYPLKVRKVPRKTRLESAAMLCKRLKIAPSKRKMHALTAFERKCAAVARGLTVPRSIVIWDDFFPSAQWMRSALCLFGDASHVVVTSNVSLAVGNTVVLDGGKTAYQGDPTGAARVVEQLGWHDISGS